MSNSSVLPQAVLLDMESKNIDVDLSLEILGRFNRGEFDHLEPVRVSDIPSVDGQTVVDFTTGPSLTVPASSARDRLAGLLPAPVLRLIGNGLGDPSGNSLTFTTKHLKTIGLALMPRVAYGVLNGGSATSYADIKKNAAFSADLMDLLDGPFDTLAQLSRGRAKGLTPAFVQPDGTLGPSFLQLKMRALLTLALQSRSVLDALCADDCGELPSPLLPLFEMTSIHTREELRTTYPEYRSDEVLADLIAFTGLDPTDPIGAVQPMISAYTHSRHGRPKQVFANAYGRPDETLPLPGGHGQNFAVLGHVYQKLYEEGKRFVYIGNVDNLGYLPDPIEVAYLALSGKQAGFDFAFKTPVDVKGGILVRDQYGKLNCADIGPAISTEEVAEARSAGKSILFNAATGLFDLAYLVPNLRRIATDLPTRFTDQSKDAGDYSQAEQVTWEVIGMLDDFVAFSVSKWDRFLAAKLLLETLMTSGIRADDPAYPGGDDDMSLRTTARHLHQGLSHKLQNEYGMELQGDVWVPVPAADLAARSA